MRIGCSLCARRAGQVHPDRFVDVPQAAQENSDSLALLQARVQTPHVTVVVDDG